MWICETSQMKWYTIKVLSAVVTLPTVRIGEWFSACNARLIPPFYSHLSADGKMHVPTLLESAFFHCFFGLFSAFFGVLGFYANPSTRESVLASVRVYKSNRLWAFVVGVSISNGVFEFGTFCFWVRFFIELGCGWVSLVNCDGN